MATLLNDLVSLFIKRICFALILDEFSFICLLYRHLEIRNSESLTMRTVSNILLYCDNIETILDLEGWSKVYQSDIEVFFLNLLLSFP